MNYTAEKFSLRQLVAGFDLSLFFPLFGFVFLLFLPIVLLEDRARELSPIPPFHFWPRFQPELLRNSYKTPQNISSYAVKKDPIQSKIVQDARADPTQLFTWVNPKSHIKFWLWTRNNPTLAQELVYEQPSTLQASNFNPELVTKVIIHGFADGASEVYIGEWILQMRDEYLELADLNILVVDYSIYARIPLYLNARPELVGTRVGEMVQWLVDFYNSTTITDQDILLSSYHLIGWSWGAHVAGFAGVHLKGKLGRITGLDPAGPTFRYVSNEYRLDAADARFVDVIHTNSNDGTAVWGGQLGLKEALGHVDVYVNGGHKQTGCPLGRTLNYGSLYCSHGRAPRYWTESIQSPLAFPICRCESFDGFVNGVCNCTDDGTGATSYMGEHQPVTDRGVYQLITRAYPPYGHGHHTRIHLSSPEHYAKPTKQRSISDDSSNGKMTITATIQHENHTHVHPLEENPFSVRAYSNNLILKESLKVINPLDI